MKLNELTALEIAKLISKKEITCTEVISFFISKVQKVNSNINAMVEDRFSEAMIEAKNIDHELQNTTETSEQILKNKPFLGVPMTVKEMIAVEHMKSTQGSVHRKTWSAQYDATVVARFKKAGAIVIGTSNVPEVGFWFECFNNVYGTTNNPWDTTRTCGGSTGGEAALIASGASVMGIGSDIGGSIRIPSAFCGIYGHKPSEGLIPITGHFPVYQNNATNFSGNRHPFTVVGPMGKSVKDLCQMMKVMMGPDGYDPEMKSAEIFGTQRSKNNYADNLELIEVDNEWTVYTVPDLQIFAVSEISAEVKEGLAQAEKILAMSGAKIKTLNPKLFFKIFDMWTARAWSVEGRDFTATLTKEQGISFLYESIKMIFSQGTYTTPAFLTALSEKYFTDKSEKDFFINELLELKKLLSAKLKDRCVLILPVFPVVAPKHKATLKTPFDFCLAGIANALGFPATAVPIGLSPKEQLPVGIQILANENKDHLTLSAAQWIYENTSKLEIPNF